MNRHRQFKKIKRIALASGLALGLTGCAGGGGVTPGPVDDFALCSAALLAAGSSSPAVLFTTAVSTPACQALAADALQLLINSVSKQQLARGVRR